MIQAVHIQKTYDRHRTQANHVLRDVTLTLPDSGFICVLGPSGCGKTTLMNVIGGLDVFDSGRITIGDISAEKYGTRAMEAERNRRFGYVFQNYYLLPERSVAYNVYLGLHSLNLSRREKLQRVRAALLDVEMDGFAKRPVKDLSGGQQQRVAIARALARHPQVIFADEPTGNLDEINTDNICRLLRRLSYSCLVVMVTHEERIASQYSDRIIRLEQGKIVSDSPNIPTEGKEEGDYGDKGDYRDKGDRTEPVGGELSGSRPVNAGEKKHDSGLRSAFGEAVRLLTAKGKHTAALWTCLAVLTAVVVLAVGDYLTVADIEPEDFIVTDSHVIDVEVMRGGISGASVSEGFQTYMNWLEEAGLEGIYLPVIGCSTSFAYDSFVQMDTLSENVYGFSYVPSTVLNPDTLICGRMPEGPEEVVADRWTLESFLSRSGVLQASIPDVTYFLGKTLTLSKKNIQLTIVGICDSEEPSVYVDPFALISFGSAGTEVMSLSQLKALYPGQYDDIILGDGEALTGPSAGIRQKVGSVYNINNHRGYRIAGLVEEDIYARLVVNDSQYEVLLKEMISSVRSFRLYTSDKETAKRLLTELPDDLVGVIQVKVTDHYTDYMNSYRAAAAKRVNARVIITLTIMGIAAVMLFLLLKARVDERREMLGVYRLLGIPNRRTLAIFAMESVCLSLVSGLPAALLTWGVIKALTVMPSLSFAMILPLRAALIAYAAAFLLHMALSLLPAVRLLCLPPAVLAAKFDF